MTDEYNNGTGVPALHRSNEFSITNISYTFNTGNPMTENAKNSARAVFDNLEEITNLQFTESDDSSGNIKFYMQGLSSGIAGQASYVWNNSSSVYINSNYYTNSSFSKGAFEHKLMLHEIGHSMGLKHPHSNSPNLSTADDSQNASVMSYYSSKSSSTGGYTATRGGPTAPWGFQIYDIAELQYKYGANHNFMSGNDDYILDSSSYKIWTIWDGAGFDTLNASSYTGGAKIDLREGLEHVTKVGLSSNWIAFGTNIENALGGSGKDTINGNKLANILNGKGGNDQIFGNEGNDSLLGQAGVDTLYAGAGDDYLDGGDDSDYIDGGLGNDVIWGETGIESGDDTINGHGGNDLIYGWLGNDEIYGGAGDDYIDGDLGDDTIEGDVGEDQIYGRWGDDIIDGGESNDSLYGGEGNDYIAGGDGDDYIDGGAGLDTVNGQNGDDYIFGSTGVDIISGGAGNDTLHGNDGSDEISGGSGDDYISGGAGVDTIEGGDNNDVLYGEAGNDSIAGGAGDDQIIAGAGDDIISGGAGLDVFVFAVGSGDDTILDFSFVDGDLLQFEGIFSDHAEALLAIDYLSGDATIDLGLGSVLTVNNILEDSFSISDLLLI